MLFARFVGIFLLNLPCADKDDTVLSRKYLRLGGDADASFHTTLHKVRAGSLQLDLSTIKPGGVATATVELAGAMPGDVVTASLSSLGDESLLVFTSARVSKPGVVLVLFKNEDAEPADVPAGVLRVVASAFG